MSSSKSTSVMDQDPDFFLEELDEDKHILDYHRMWSDPASLIWSTQAPKTTLADTRAWLRRFSKAADPQNHNYAILLRSDSTLNPTTPTSSFAPPPSLARVPDLPVPAGPSDDHPRPYLIGTVGALRPANAAADAAPAIGYMIHHTHWGRGLAQRAVRRFLELYWTVLNPPGAGGADALEAHIDPANAASEHIAQKMGFEPGEFAADEFRLAHSNEARKMRIWRVRRPEAKAEGEAEARLPAVEIGA